MIGRRALVVFAAFAPTVFAPTAQLFGAGERVGSGPRTPYRAEDWTHAWWRLEEWRLRRRIAPAPAPEWDESLRRRILDALERTARLDADPEVRGAALLALGRSEDPQVLDTLLAALEEGSLELRRLAALALGAWGGTAALPVLTAVVADEGASSALRRDAALALGLLRAPKRRPPPRPPEAIPIGRADRPLVALGARGESLVALASDLGVWTFLPGVEPTRSARPSDHVSALVRRGVWLPDQERFLALLDDGRLVSVSGRGSPAARPLAERAAAFAVEPGEGRRVGVLGSSGRADVRRVRDGQVLCELEASEPLAALAWSPDGRRLLAWHAGGRLTIHSARSGRALGAPDWSRPPGRLVTLPGAGLVALIDGEGGLAWHPSDPRAAVETAPPIGRRVLDAVAGGGSLVVLLEGGEVLALDPDGDRTVLLPAGGPPPQRLFALPGGALYLFRRDGTLARLPDPQAAGSIPPDPTGALAAFLEPGTFLGLDDPTRRALALACQVRGDPALLPPIEALLTRRAGVGGTLRAVLAGAAAACATEDDVPRLAPLASSNEGAVRRALASALWLPHRRGAAALFAERIAGELGREGDLRVRTAGSLALGSSAPSGAPPDALLDEFADALQSVGRRLAVVDVARIRLGARSRAAYAAIALGICRAGGASRALLSAYRREEDLLARSALALALGLVGAVEAGPLLLRSVRTSAEPVTLSYHALAVGLLAPAGAEARLRKLLEESDDWEVLLRAAWAFEALGDPTGREILALRLRGRDDRAAAGAAYALGCVGDRRAAAEILALLTGPRSPAPVRRAACVALGRLLSPGSPPADLALRARLDPELDATWLEEVRVLP